MKLEGIHHVTCITGDAPGNVDFYTRVLGLRLVKKTVNQDDPTVYHLFYADEAGSPGADITFFEYPGAARGRAGAGMVHRIVWRVASEEALDLLGCATRRRGRRRGARGRTLALRRPRRARPRARGRGDDRRAAGRDASGRSRGGCAPGVRRGARLRARARRAAGPCSRRRLLSGRPAATAGRHAERGAAASMPTIRLRPSAASPGRAPFTTSPGRRRWTTTRPGASGPRRPGRNPPRSSTASGSTRSTSGSRAAYSSRSRRSARASPSTRTLSIWVRR